MFAPAWLLPPHQPEYRTGVSIGVLVHCIATVSVWNNTATGGRDWAAVLVVFIELFRWSPSCCSPIST